MEKRELLNESQGSQFSSTFKKYQESRNYETQFEEDEDQESVVEFSSIKKESSDE